MKPSLRKDLTEGVNPNTGKYDPQVTPPTLDDELWNRLPMKLRELITNFATATADNVCSRSPEYTAKLIEAKHELATYLAEMIK